MMRPAFMDIRRTIHLLNTWISEGIHVPPLQMKTPNVSYFQENLT